MVFGGTWVVVLVLGLRRVCAGEVMPLGGFGGREVGLADGAEVVVKGGYMGILIPYRK